MGLGPVHVGTCGQAYHSSLREDSEVMPSRDMGLPDGRASLCPKGSHLPPWKHKSDQSRGVNSGVGASLTRGEGSYKVAYSGQGRGAEGVRRKHRDL